MNIFSTLFSSATPSSTSPDNSKHIQHLKELFSQETEIFTKLPIFNQNKKYIIEYIMIHPQMGVLIFHNFMYDANELKGLKASPAPLNTNNADIKTIDTKNFLKQRFNDLFHTQIAPVRSILICPNLSESEFNELDSSFHELIPKEAALFNDTDNIRYKEIFIPDTNQKYDIQKIKRALFSELVVSKTLSLMNKEQENFVHQDFKENILLYGLPGSGKSVSLISKALYEKMKAPHLKLMIFAKHSCSVYQLQSLVFSFIENSNWGLNPAEIKVSNFNSIRKRASEKEKYDLIICDDINEEDLPSLLKLLSKHGKLIASSHYKIEALKTITLSESYRLSSTLCAACEGFRVDNLKHSLSLLSGNIFMNSLLTLANVLKTAQPSDICIVHNTKEELLNLQQEIDTYFTPITYLFDDNGTKHGIGLYPLSHLSCLNTKYMIIIVDETSCYDPIELISRAQTKTFILSQSEGVYNIINTIKESIKD
ncbi:MAG TPA: hypothetical protein EYO73_03805 [Sulfurimonas sp.]|nr:hypothetical protein [Sulfurimonas sp.]